MIVGPAFSAMLFAYYGRLMVLGKQDAYRLLTRSLSSLLVRIGNPMVCKLRAQLAPCLP